MSAPCSTPRAPVVSGAEWRRVSSPSPAASTPISSTSASSTNGMNVPIAFEPPPTQAIARSGSRPGLVEQLRARLVADAALEVAHQRRVRRRPDARADHVVRGVHVRDPVADRRGHGLLERARAGVDARAPRRRAAACAARSAPGGACPRCPCRRRTRGRAARTPWPPPRRAGRRRSRRSRAACPSAARAAPGPSALLILCEPVWVRSSRFSQTAPPTSSESRCAW